MDTPLVKRAYNLGLKAVPNFVEALDEKQIAYYEQHLDELLPALCRGFVIPSQEVRIVPAVIAPPPTLFKVGDTDLGMWLTKTEEFAKKHLGIEVKLREMFVIPEELPWKSIIPAFDPGGLTNRSAIDKALKALSFSVYEEVDVMQYSGSEANAEPTLHFIQNSIRPDEDTMKMSPDNLVVTGKNWLDLRGYALAFGLHYFVTKKYLDPKTFTWFPENRLHSGEVAGGFWYPDDRKVRFSWGGAVGEDSGGGARLAMPVPLKT